MDDAARSDRPAGVPRDVDADLVDEGEAAAIVGVDRSRIAVMVDQGLLTVASEPGGARRFRRAEAEAVRLAGA